ncbi:hypothetical protein OEZ85_007858 [Tetradesmus obliquus]|uniref:Uncharacterized protein n=1 Tax=Tetradesmus obliquus TaxID=3088 RepID=A0ABY8THE6_TETOB|nr:hypothetical protein OEZ85_007858 [Tetradesmus obliquus]
MKHGVPVMVVVLLLLTVALEAAPVGKPRAPLCRKRSALSLPAPTQDASTPVDLGSATCDFAPIQVDLAQAPQASENGGFYYQVGPFEAPGTLFAETYGGSDETGCWDSLIEVLLVEQGNTYTAGWFNNENGWCAQMAYSVSDYDVEQKRKFLIRFSNSAYGYYDPWWGSEPHTTYGGYTFRMAYTCLNISTCPSVTISNVFLPPNGKMVNMNITALPLRPSLPSPELRITAIQQNQPVPAVKNGRPKATAVYSTGFTAGGTVNYQLAADRDGSNQAGRTYFVSYEARTDDGSCTGMAKEPRLLSVGQAQLVSSVEAVEQVCSWPLLRLLPALRAHPRLLVTPGERLYAAAATLQQQLRLSEEGLALALRRAPAALLVPAGQLADLLAELAANLAVPTDVAADILLQEPQLLLRRPGAVSAVLGSLRSTFQLSSDELLQVVEYDPTVLCWSPGSLADSSSKFKEAAGRHKAWAAEYKQLMSKPVNVARALRIEPLRLLRLTFLLRSRMAASCSLKAAVSMSGRQFVGQYPGYAAWLAQHYSAGGVPRQYRGIELDEDEDEDDEGEEE